MALPGVRDVRSNKAPIKSLIPKALRNLIGMLFGGESLSGVDDDIELA
jgi:hypothetical protein